MDRRINTVFLAVSLLFAAHLNAQNQEPTASDGWIALPGDGETSASAFAEVSNPSMYDAYLVSAASDAAEKVEFRDGSGAPVRELTVPAYGKLSMGPGEAHMVLIGLNRDLEEDDTVPITLETDGGVELQIEAVVRAE